MEYYKQTDNENKILLQRKKKINRCCLPEFSFAVVSLTVGPNGITDDSVLA